MKRLSILFIMLFAWVQAAQAGGLQVPEMGVKSMGMANAFTAVANDPSANWFNPAGLAFQKGAAVTAGGVVVLPKVDFTENSSNPSPGVSSSSIDKKTIAIPHAYIGINTESDLAAGIGINSPFGLEVQWPTTAVFAAGAQRGRLQTINVNPNVAFKLSDTFSVAAGIDYVDMYRVNFDGTALLQNFKGDGWGYNLAALYKTKLFNVGVSYRSSVKIKAKGQSTHTVSSTTSNNAITVTMPDMLSIGIAFHPTEQWIVSVDADRVNWKKFDQLAFVYTPALAGGRLPSLNVPEKWKAVWAYRIGMEWAYSPVMRARFGYTYDPTPIKDVNFTPIIPGNDRQAVHVGYGADISDHATIDIAYMYVWLTKRHQTQSTGTNIVRNGIYKSSIHLVSASLTYRF